MRVRKRAGQIAGSGKCKGTEGEQVMVPKDPVALLSFLNLKLRDFYPDLETLCDDLELDQAGITRKLEMLDYHYDREQNQFV